MKEIFRTCVRVVGWLYHFVGIHFGKLSNKKATLEKEAPWDKFLPEVARAPTEAGAGAGLGAERSR
jgi:hypothetical protein